MRSGAITSRQISHLRASSPALNGDTRFTSGATPADLLTFLAGAGIGCLFITTNVCVQTYFRFTSGATPADLLTFLAGAGIGCLFITSNVSVQTYFTKRRSLAFSIAVTGTAVGVFSFPQLTRLLIDNYAWQGAVLVYGM